MWGGDFAFTEIPMPCKRSPFDVYKESFWHLKGVLLQGKTSPFEQQKDYIWKATASRRVYNEQKKPVTIKKTTI